MRSRFRSTTVIAVSVGVAIVTLWAALLGYSLRAVTYESTAEILIAPASGSEAGGADTLSRGTVVTTFSEAWTGTIPVAQALTDAGLADRLDRVEVDSQVVAGTSIIRLTGTSTAPDLARLAVRAVAASPPSLAGFSEAFVPQVLEPGSAPERAGPAIAVVALAAVLLAALTGGLTAWILTRGRPRAGPAMPPHEPTERDGQTHLQPMGRDR